MSAKLRIGTPGLCLPSASLALPCCSGARAGSCAAFVGDTRLHSTCAALAALPVLALPFAAAWAGCRGTGCSSRLLVLGAAAVLGAASLALLCPLACELGCAPLLGLEGLGSRAWRTGAASGVGCGEVLSAAFPAVLRLALAPACGLPLCVLLEGAVLAWHRSPFDLGACIPCR